MTSTTMKTSSRRGSRRASGPKKGKSLVWKPDNSPFYHMDFRVKGKRITGSTKMTNRQDAQAFAKSERDKAIAMVVKLGPAHGRDMTFLAAADRYFRERGQFAVNSYKIEMALDWLVDRIGEKTMISQVDDEMLARLMSERREMCRYDDPSLGKVSSNTVNQHVLDIVRVVLTRARKSWKVPLPDEPNYKEHRLPIKARVQELKVSQEIALSGQRPDYWALCQFILATGLRKRDALITWDNVDWDDGVIRTTVKGDKHHEVLITPEIEKMLLSQVGHHNTYVWTFVETRTWTRKATGETYHKGQRYPITYNRFGGNFASMRERAGIKNIRIHDLRKTAGARMHRATGDLVAVQTLLGHANISLTRKHYIRITPQDVRRRMMATSEYYRNVFDGARGGVADPADSIEA